MRSTGSHESSGTTWFVGASFGHTDDQSARFLEEGIWEISSPSQKEQALVRSMRPGERIAIKAAYVRKHGLPFDNRQQTVSVMGIKAIGIISENPQDGERVKVQWQPAVGTMVDETVVIQGHPLRFATVDLAAKPAEIRAQLLRCVEMSC